MFKEVRAHIPGLFSWEESSYGAELLSHFGDQQGDPLGPLCFVLALHPIIECIKI